LLKTEDFDLEMELLLQQCPVKLVKFVTKIPDGEAYRLPANREI
jgi:hypothetical protein